MRQYYFNAYLTTEQCEAYYRGAVKYVVVTADSGERVQLQFHHLRPIIGSAGLRGRFRLSVSEQGAFQRLEKIN